MREEVKKVEIKHLVINFFSGNPKNRCGRERKTKMFGVIGGYEGDVFLVFSEIDENILRTLLIFAKNEVWLTDKSSLTTLLLNKIFVSLIPFSFCAIIPFGHFISQVLFYCLLIYGLKTFLAVGLLKRRINKIADTCRSVTIHLWIFMSVCRVPYRKEM